MSRTNKDKNRKDKIVESKKRKKLTVEAIKAIRKNERLSNLTTKKVKLKDLEKFSKSVRFPIKWREEIEKHIDYPSDLSSFIVEAIKEKMDREDINTFLG